MRKDPALSLEPRLSYDLAGANHQLGLAPKSDWLLSPDCPIPRTDIRKAGAGQALWRWRRADLEEFLESRLVRPGQLNPMQSY